MKQRFGIVCVHGIGQQEQGQTTREVATAVRRGAKALGGSASDVGSPADALPGTISLDVDIPSCEPFEVALHDGRWDHLVEPPPWRTVLLWTLRVAPFALWMTMSGWLADIVTVQGRRGRNAGVLKLLPVGTVMLIPILAPLLVVFAVLIAPVLLMNKRWGMAARNIMSSWVGDAWMYRSDRLDESVIAPVRSLVEQVSKRSDATVLVGHSQGAEIGRRIAITTEIDSCVWIGSGEFPLGVVRTLRRSPGVVVALWAVLLTFPLLFAMVSTALWQGIVGLLAGVVGAFTWMWPPRLITPDDLSGRMELVSDGFIDFALSELDEIVWVAAYVILAVWLLTRFLRAPADQLTQPACEVFVVKSLLDPVCLGPRDAAEFVRYVPAGRPSAWWREHMAYFEKAESGITVLEAIVGSRAIGREPYSPRLGIGIHILGACAATAMAYGLWALGTWMLNLLPF